MTSHLYLSLIYLIILISAIRGHYFFTTPSHSKQKIAETLAYLNVNFCVN